MDKLKTFPKEDHEKKQLEEIAHLYFSDPAKPTKPLKEPETRSRAFESFRRSPRTLFVYCITGRPEHDLSTWFLFNLAVMLKILNGPVLLIGSERSYEKRFLFGFRPDRERVTPGKRMAIPSSIFGPMGVCLLDGRLLGGDFSDVQAGYGTDQRGGGKVSFRYVLSDEVRSGAGFGSVPTLALLLVTPTTMARDLLDFEEEEEEELFAKVSHVGIVVAGAGSSQEAQALYLYWRDRVEARRQEDLVVENFGVLPLGTRRAGMELGGVEILESPAGEQARRYQETAALVRKKRSEMVSMSAR